MGRKYLSKSCAFLNTELHKTFSSVFTIFIIYINTIFAMIAPDDSRPFVDIVIAGTEMAFTCHFDLGSITSILIIEQYNKFGSPEHFQQKREKIVTVAENKTFHYRLIMHSYCD